MSKTKRTNPTFESDFGALEDPARFSNRIDFRNKPFFSTPVSTLRTIRTYNNIVNRFHPGNGNNAAAKRRETRSFRETHTTVYIYYIIPTLSRRRVSAGVWRGEESKFKLRADTTGRVSEFFPTHTHARPAYMYATSPPESAAVSVVAHTLSRSIFSSFFFVVHKSRPSTIVCVDV